MNDIQQLINNGADTIIQLPLGEYEGPFYIKSPCCIIGNSTTLWTKKGPTLVIQSLHVTVQNLRVEVLEEEENDCIISNFPDTEFDTVEIIGKVKGILEEEGFWDIPETISLREVPSQTECHFIIEVIVPTEVTIVSLIEDIQIYPKKLKKGRNRITIAVGKMRTGTYIYGNFLFSSFFIRRIYVSGVVKDNVKEYCDNKILFQAQTEVRTVQEEYEAAKPIIIDPKAIYLKKGQRISCEILNSSDIQIEFLYTKKLKDMEIDPYIFLLDKNNQAQNDEDLIFFGNKTSLDGGVKLIEQLKETIILLNLTKVSVNINRICIAYAVYGENPDFNFSKIIDVTMKIKSRQEEKIIFQPKDLFAETAVVFVEFYRYKDIWKINTVGAGYQEGLKKLCESYGIEIEE